MHLKSSTEITSLTTTFVVVRHQQGLASKISNAKRQPDRIQLKEQLNNSIDWWKNNEINFPILARLAKIYLPIQATSAPSERIFSRASRIISNLRTGLSPEMAGRLLFVSSNWDWYQKEVTLQQTLREMTTD